MKINCWLLFGAMLSGSLLAQQVTNAPSGAPSGTTAAPTLAEASTNVPAPAPAAKKAGKKAPRPAAKKPDPAAELKTVPLVPGPAVVDANNVNVRGQARLKSEVVTRMSKGQPVTVLEEIVRNNSAADEPSAWAKIMLPTNVHVWVHTSFIDPTAKTVVPRKLNVRSGPGENYSVLGQLLRGDPVTEVGTKDNWIKILPPTNAYAFMAAQYLKQEPSTPAVPPTTPATPAEPPAIAATPQTVTEPPAVAAAPTEPPAVPPTTEPPAITNASAEIAAATTNTPAADEPPPKRIVQREGMVRGTSSIQAPTHFGLFNLETGKMVDYLLTTSPSLDLRRYKGLHVIVTGEEGLEERWGNTPVITIQKIQVID